jgi:hypothetical protein
MPIRSKTLAALVCGVLCAAPLPAAAADVVTEWNQIALTKTLTVVPAQAPVQQTRTMAIVQVAVHDAINAFTREFQTYGSPPSPPANGSVEAAAIAAAHQALKALFPGQADSLDASFAASLAAHGLSALDEGIAFGRAVADAILALRANDRAANAQFDYTVPGAGQIGVWTRLNGAAALLPGWGSVTPWVLRSGDQFRPPAPIDLASDAWAADYNEVLTVGALNSATRTTEQTNIALFWRASPAAIWNPVLAQQLPAANLDLSATARAFALIYLAAADASIACWDAKYVYNFWRPFPAIANGDLDPNPMTAGDPLWRPLLATPPHPEYPSGHSSVSSAMAAALDQLFGKTAPVPIEVTLTGVTRNWTTFQQAVDEVIDARVYSGIHYRTSDVIGARMGRQVAQFVMTHALRPVPPGQK